MSSVVRSQLGDVHQVSSLLEETLKVDGRAETHGIKIILSKSPLDDSDPGYQHPEAKGFFTQPQRKRKIPERKKTAKKRITDENDSSQKKVTESNKENNDVSQPAKKKKYRKKLSDETTSDAKVESNSKVELKAVADSETKPKESKRERSFKRAAEEKD